MIREETAQIEVPHRKDIRAHVNNLKICPTRRSGPTQIVPPPVSKWLKFRDPTPPRPNENENEKGPEAGDMGEEVTEKSGQKRKRQVSFSVPKLPRVLQRTKLTEEREKEEEMGRSEKEPETVPEENTDNRRMT